MSTHHVDNAASFILIAEELAKSFDPYDRAAGRAIKKLLPNLMEHVKAENLSHWGNAAAFEKSLRATGRTLGIAAYLVGVQASGGDPRKLAVITDALIRDMAASAMEQLQQATPITRNAPSSIIKQ